MAHIQPLHTPFWLIVDHLCSNHDYEDDEDALAFDQQHHESPLTPLPLPTPQLCSSPVPYEDGPTVSTPGAPSSLPAPMRPLRLFRSSHVPEVASPVDSPAQSSSAGRSKRVDPATPLPLGEATFSRLRKKPGHQKMSKLLEIFEKNLVKEAVKPRRRISGNERPLEGCRICLAIDESATGANSKPARWAQVSLGLSYSLPQISDLGGQVVLQPDTAITHVIYEGSSGSALARMLGLSALSELPEGTICVKWAWVGSCKVEVSLETYTR